MDVVSPAADHVNDAEIRDSPIHKEHHSDKETFLAHTVTQIVMAEQITHDVVKEAQSMGGPAPIDDTATSTNALAGNGAPDANPKLSESTFINATKEVVRSDEDPAADQRDKEPIQLAPTAATETKEQLVNGDAGEQSASDDVGVSGGSDTDISRPGSVDPTKERATGHLRSNSLKKPASFKSVSVTKNFLAKSAVSTPSPGPGAKVAAIGQTNGPTLLTAKPRLVAKSGSGIGNTARSGLNVNGAGTGPDASKVWNKNQPVAPPPPKQFTDEELKQQYGIHLATRLQADDASKEAKWADIDDDEDDWAPETVQWMDGTKSTVAPAENDPPPPEEPKPIQNEPSTETPAATTTPITISQRPSATSGTKTILKPGAHAQTTSTKTGLVLKGQPEKATLVAKPSAPTPVKSPWASLPPVDKVSPVQIHPSVQPPPRFSQRDSHGYDAMLPPHPAKEIAPDDFNRSWRDDRGNRELFNSHSGRYEPVNEMRRGSVRESYRQQPSVLQRPSQDGPAEPSAAFQTSRTSADTPTWGRRRNSSNLSGGSGRRMSIDRHHVPDLPSVPMNVQRRGSHSINGADAVSPSSPRLAFSQKAGHGDPSHGLMTEQHAWAQKSSPNLSNAQPASPFGSVPSIGTHDGIAPGSQGQTEDPVEVQNRMMREKIERARLAKQKEREQEEQEEAERKERLRKKLEAMGLSQEAKPKSKEPSPARPEKSPQKDRAVPAPVLSPPKPPIPTAEGEVAQYGMMKVHQPHPVKKTLHGETASKPVPKPSPSPVRGQSEGQSRSGPSPNESAPQHSSASTRENKTNPSSLEPLQGDARSHNQVPKSAQSQQSGWSGSNLPSQSRPWGSNNVWGPPQARDRALGNGTFDAGYNPAQPRANQPQLPSQSQGGQTPTLGLNQSLKPSSSQAQSLHSQPFSQQTLYGQAESMPTQQPSAATKPGPIGTPATKGWGDFRNTISLDDKAMTVKAKQELERLGGETFRPEIRETYTDKQGRSQKTVHSKVGGNVALTQNGIKPESTQTITSELKPKEEGQAPITQGAHLQATGTAARSSRFFPRTSEAVSQPPTTTSKSDSPPPPPPETESHPAFIGDIDHPIVKMPRPSPRVRLPPSVTEQNAPAEAAVTMPSRARVGLGARPLALNPEWQARFNSLLDKAPASVPAPIAKPASVASSAANAKSGVLAVAASSKAPLEVRANSASATVSLPNTPTKKVFVYDNSSEVTTRLSAEEILLEEREFGSLPIVKVSKVPHLAANEPAVGFPRSNSRWQKPYLDTTTKPVLHILDFDRNATTIDVKIRLANMREAIIKAVAKRAQHSKGPGQKGPKRNFSSSSGGSPSSGQNQRSSRKPSNYQGGQGSGSNSNSSPRPSGGNGWGSSRSTPPHNSGHNSSTWTRRAAPVH